MSVQSMAALAHANEVRLARSALKRDVRAGTVGLEEALAAPCAQEMDLRDLLMAQRDWGERRADGFMEDLCFDRLCRVGQVLPAHRAEVAAEAAGWVRGRVA